MRTASFTAAIVALVACGPPDANRDPCEQCRPPRSTWFDDAGVPTDASGVLADDAGDAGDAGDPAIDAGQPLVCYVGCGSEDDPACDPHALGCVEECDAEHPCQKEGHACIPYADKRVCSFDCMSTACGPRRECRSGDCTDVECGSIVKCANSADICDPKAYRCYPFDGRCKTADDCPLFDGYWKTNASIVCEAGYCSVRLPPPQQPPGLTNVPPVGVVTPIPATTYQDESQVVIAWASDFSAGASTIVLAIDGLPVLMSDLKDHAVWGAALQPDKKGPITLADGQLVKDGEWTQQSGSLPHNRLLALVVETVKEGQLIAVSNVVPFSIGSAWRKRGDACNPFNGPRDCANPIEVLSCHPTTFTCERVCGSYRDCLDLIPARDCGAPRGYNRYCE